jgi:hypothetical protein
LHIYRLISSFYRQKALIKKAREDEIAAERAERENLRQNLKGRASVARYEEEKAAKAANSSKASAQKSTSGAKQRGSTFKRGDYNPLTGAGGGSSKFTSGEIYKRKKIYKIN